jgi:hypothetical protein
VLLAAGLVGGGWAVVKLAAQPVPTRLPPTPRAWLDAYEAAAIDDPARVCSELFSPQLAQAYATAMHGSCRSYFQEITSVSVRIRRVLQEDRTAVLELQQSVRPRVWTIVLSREQGGWQAVDLVGGRLVR